MSRAGKILSKIQEVKKRVGENASTNDLGKTPVTKVKPRKKQQEGNSQVDISVEEGSGVHKHTHTGFYDCTLQEGQLTTTDGDGPDHNHVVQEKQKLDDGKIVVETLPGGDDNHTHPDLTLNPSKVGEPAEEASQVPKTKVARSIMEAFQTVEGNAPSGVRESKSSKSDKSKISRSIMKAFQEVK